MAASLTARHAAGHQSVPGTRVMVPLLRYLRDADAGVAPAAAPSLTPLGVLLGQYRAWLIQGRGLGRCSSELHKASSCGHSKDGGRASGAPRKIPGPAMSTRRVIWCLPV